MSDQSKQKRQPTGLPTGGQFDSNEHDEAPGSLHSGQPADRSFLYPPYLDSADAVIDYYEDIPIDDAMVSKFIDAYGTARAEWAQEHMEQFDADLKQRYDGDKAKFNDAHWAEFRRMEEEHPTFVNPIFARDVTRAVQMARIAEWSLPPEEEAKLLGHKLTLTNGVRQPIGEIKTRYLVGQHEGDLV